MTVPNTRSGGDRADSERQVVSCKEFCNETTKFNQKLWHCGIFNYYCSSHKQAAIQVDVQLLKFLLLVTAAVAARVTAALLMLLLLLLLPLLLLPLLPLLLHDRT